MLLLSPLLLAKEKINLEGRLVQEHYLKKSDLNRPAGVFVKLFSWRSKQGEHCIVYKTPIKKRKGILYLLNSKKCQLSKSDKSEIKSNINNLSIEKLDSSIVLNIDDEIMTFSFPYNSEFKFIKLKKEKYTKVETGKLCRKFEASCLDKIKNECHHCEGNIWTAELNWQCSRETERRCGAFRCGQKNQSACVKFMPKKSSISCFDAAKYVYCKPGLSHFCEGSGRIICK